MEEGQFTTIDIEETPKCHDKLASGADQTLGHTVTMVDWLFNNCAEPFIPYQKKEISENGRRNMGYYGFIVIAFIVVTTGMSTMALINSGVTEPYVLVVLALPFIISVLSATRFVAGIMHSCLKKYQ